MVPGAHVKNSVLIAHLPGMRPAGLPISAEGLARFPREGARPIPVSLLRLPTPFLSGPSNSDISGPDETTIFPSRNFALGQAVTNRVSAIPPG